MKLVSVIIPTYNSATTIKRSVESVINQSYKNIEVLVVDDGSNDNTRLIVETMQNGKGSIKYLYKDNGGVSSARNFGINKASGDLILFLDSDDYLDDMAILNCVQKYENKSLVKLASRNIINGKSIEEHFHKLEYSSTEFISEIIKQSQKGFCWGILYEQKNLKNSLFDPEIGFMEDMLFLIKYLNYVDKVLIVDNSFYNYCLYEGSATNNINNVLRNIGNANLVLNEIEVIGDQIKDIHLLILMLKCRIIESEVFKYNSIEVIKTINSDNNTKQILLVLIKENNIKFLYKILFRAIINNRKNSILLYINIRKLLKHLKRR